MTGSKVAVDNALNPAWRDSIVHLIVSQSWNESLPSDLREQVMFNMTYGKGHALRQLAPNTGCYVNEVKQWPFLLSPHLDKRRYDSFPQWLTALYPRPTHTNQTGNHRFLGRTTPGFMQSSAAMIPRVYFGVVIVLVVRRGPRRRTEGCVLPFEAGWVN
jgi:hypothetical protein